MRPEQIAKTSESSHQRAFFAWCAVAAQFGIESADHWAAGSGLLHTEQLAIPPLKWIHAIPNGGARGDTEKSRTIRGSQLKAEGVKPGVGDTFFPYYSPLWLKNGLYLEFKKPKLKPKTSRGKGGLKPEQIEFRDYVVTQNFIYVVVYSWVEAVNTLKKYLEY